MSLPVHNIVFHFYLFSSIQSLSRVQLYLFRTSSISLSNICSFRHRDLAHHLLDYTNTNIVIFTIIFPLFVSGIEIHLTFLYSPLSCVTWTLINYFFLEVNSFRFSIYTTCFLQIKSYSFFPILISFISFSCLNAFS